MESGDAMITAKTSDTEAEHGHISEEIRSLEEAGHVSLRQKVMEGVDKDVDRSRGAGTERRPLPCNN